MQFMTERPGCKTQPGRFEDAKAVSADRDQIDHEDQRLAAEEVTARRAVGQVRRNHQLTTSADLHARDAVLPPLDESAQRELNALTAVPGGVELLAGLVLDARV